MRITAVRVALGGLLALLMLAACSRQETTPTYRVERQRFEHRVTAEGGLKAENAIGVTVPTEVRRSVRLAWIAPEGTLVKAGDLIARFDATEMTERLEGGRSDLTSAGLEVEKTRIESGAKITALDTLLEVARLELDIAQRFGKTDDQVFSRQEIVESDIDRQLAGERREHATGSRHTQQLLGRTELDLLGIKQRQAQLVIDQAEDGLRALEVRAPHDGIVTLVRDWNGESPQVGAEMWRGQKIAEIPDLSRMEAEVFVLEADAGGLEVGKPATVVVEADPETTYAARIRRIETVAKPRFRGSPVQYFGVVLELVGEASAEALKPGARVRATLLLDEVDDALVVPRQAVVREAGEARVFVRRGGGWQVRRIDTGSSSLGLIVVTGGLEEGDLVALHPPTTGDPSSDAEHDTVQRLAAPSP